MHTRSTIHDVMRLAELELDSWPARSAAIPSWHPRNEETPEEKAAREAAEAEAAAGGGGGGGGGGEYTPPSQADWDNTQRKLREAEDERKKLADEKAARERKEAEDKGEHQKIADQEKARADAAEQERDRIRNEVKVERIARRLKFRDPDDVIGRLSADDLADDSKIEKKLKDIAKQKPYLVDGAETQRQRDVTGDGGPGGTGGDDEPIAGTSRLARAYASKGT